MEASEESEIAMPFTTVLNRFTYDNTFEVQIVSGMQTDFALQVNIALQDNWILDPSTFKANVEVNGDEFFHLLMFREL